MTDDTSEDRDLDEQDELDEDELPQRMPYPVKLLAFLLGAISLVTGFSAYANFTTGDRLGPAVFLTTVAVAAVVAVVGLVLRRRWGSYVAFGMALILALASLQTPGVLIAALAFLGVVMGTLMTRSAKDWLGFA